MAPQLWLLRHGEAVPHESKPDAERELTPRGERQAIAAGRGSRRLGRRVRRLLHEPEGARARHRPARLPGAEHRAGRGESLADGFDREDALELLAPRRRRARARGRPRAVVLEVVTTSPAARSTSRRAASPLCAREPRSGELLVLLRPRELESLAATVSGVAPESRIPDGEQEQDARELEHEGDPERVADTRSVGDRSPEEHADGHSGERAEPVVRAHARQQLLRHVPLLGGLPQVVGDRQAGARQQRGRRGDPGTAAGIARKASGRGVERDRQRRPTSAGRWGQKTQSTMPPTSRPTPNAEEIKDHAPRAAELAVRHQRAEHSSRRRTSCSRTSSTPTVVHSHVRERQVVPAIAQVGDERVRLDRHLAWGIGMCDQEQGALTLEGGGVDGERPVQRRRQPRARLRPRARRSGGRPRSARAARWPAGGARC